MSFEFNEPEEKKKGTAGSGKAAKASVLDEKPSEADRKSTRLNSSH